MGCILLGGVTGIISVSLTCWHLNKRLNVSHVVACNSLLLSKHFFSDEMHSVCDIACTHIWKKGENEK